MEARMSEPAKVFEDRVTPEQWRVEWFDDDWQLRGGDFHRPRRTAARAAVRHAEVRAF